MFDLKLEYWRSVLSYNEYQQWDQITCCRDSTTLRPGIQPSDSKCSNFGKFGCDSREGLVWDVLISVMFTHLWIHPLPL
jgi:hypothetical protein